MLDQKDLQAIAELIDARALKTEDKITRVEKMLTNELVKTEDKLCHRIARVEKSIEEFKGYFKLERKDNEGVDLTVRLRKVANC